MSPVPDHIQPEMSSLTIGVLLLMFATLHVCARKDEIFDVTEKVLGLKRRDFEIAERSEILTQKIMREDIQEKFDVMEEKSPDALNFVRKLILDAKAVQINEYNEREALKKLRELYQILPGSAKNVLWKLFPKLDSALSGEPGNSSVTGTRKQGTHGPSTAIPGTRKQGTHGPSTAIPGSHNKPFNGGMRATVELELAKESLQGLPFPIAYNDVREKINDLLAMEPKDWTEQHLKQVLLSFENGLNYRIATVANAQSITTEDFFKAVQFLIRLCRAFTHKGGCNIEYIEASIVGLSSFPKPEAKLRGLANIIQSQIEDL